MADDSNEQTNPEAAAKPAKERREIPGNFSYTNSPGVLGKVVQKLIVSERPPQFTQDFLGSVLQATGGSARPIIPILKRAGILRADGVPTDLYAQFQSDSRRPNAALEALKTGWPELFRRNQYAHRLDAKQTEDLFVEITGLTRNDPVLKSIMSTYNVFKEFAKTAADGVVTEERPDVRQRTDESQEEVEGIAHGKVKLGLMNQITIVLPETTDIAV